MGIPYKYGSGLSQIQASITPFKMSESVRDLDMPLKNLQCVSQHPVTILVCVRSDCSGNGGRRQASDPRNPEGSTAIGTCEPGEDKRDRGTSRGESSAVDQPSPWVVRREVIQVLARKHRREMTLKGRGAITE